MSHAQMLVEAIRLHAAATTPIERLATYLMMVSQVRAIRRGDAS